MISEGSCDTERSLRNLFSKILPENILEFLEYVNLKKILEF